MNADEDLELSSLLDDFASRVPGVTHLVAISTDGLLLARSQGLGRDEADRVAAVGSGLVTLLRSAARHLEAGELESNLTVLQGGFMVTMAAPNGASVLALASRQCDTGQISFELADLIDRAGPALDPAARADLPSTLGAGTGW